MAYRMTDAVKASEIFEAAYDTTDDLTDNPALDALLRLSEKNVVEARIQDDEDLEAALYFAATHSLDLMSEPVLQKAKCFRNAKLNAQKRKAGHALRECVGLVAV